MKTLSELKSAALQSLKGKWALCVFATLVYFLCCIPYSYINFKIQFQNFSEPSFNSMNLLLLMYAYLFIIMMPLAYGYSVSFLKFVREDDDYMISQMFRNFANYKRAFLVPLIVFIYTVLWSLLLIIPGIIKSLSYSMTYFISKDHPEYTINECIEESMRIMKGNKWRLFILQLSFIGWILLTILTLGIGILWLLPYMYITIVHFYEEIKNGNQPQQIEEETEN